MYSAAATAAVTAAAGGGGGGGGAAAATARHREIETDRQVGQRQRRRLNFVLHVWWRQRQPTEWHHFMTTPFLVRFSLNCPMTTRIVQQQGGKAVSLRSCTAVQGFEPATMAVGLLPGSRLDLFARSGYPFLGRQVSLA